MDTANGGQQDAINGGAFGRGRGRVGEGKGGGRREEHLKRCLNLSSPLALYNTHQLQLFPFYSGLSGF